VKEVSSMFHRILLAVDGSEHSNKGVPIAGDLGRRYGAEVVVFHVREHELSWAGGIDVETGQESFDLVDGIVRTLKDQGASARGEVVRAPLGQTAQAILEACAEDDVDLIVMGSRGLSEWGRLLMGSVAHKIVHLTRVPVLIAR
jgi:nucleotide-binding universal stress UspA family protein